MFIYCTINYQRHYGNLIRIFISVQSNASISHVINIGWFQISQLIISISCYSCMNMYHSQTFQFAGRTVYSFINAHINKTRGFTLAKLNLRITLDSKPKQMGEIEIVILWTLYVCYFVIGSDAIPHQTTS